MSDLFTFQKQYEEFCKIDDFNLEERAKRIPAEKHFWVARLMDKKIERDRLEKQKAKLVQELNQRISADRNSPVSINKNDLLATVHNTPAVSDLREKINVLDYTIEYLELLVKQVTFIAQDIKNIIEIKKLETT